MTLMDYIILICMGGGLISGMMQGVLKQAAALVGIIAGLLIARALYEATGDYLAPKIHVSVSFAQMLSFAMIWVAIPCVLSIVAAQLTKVLDAIMLGGVNRLLGGVLGAVICFLWIGIFFQLMHYIGAERKWADATIVKDSVLYQPAKELAGLFIPTIKQLTEQIIIK